MEFQNSDGETIKAIRLDDYDYPDSVEPPHTQKIELSDPKRCSHKDLKLISSTEVRCSCGAGWTGPGVYKLLEK